MKINFTLTGILLFFSVILFAQTIQEEEKPQPLTRILFVMDASQSMYGRWQSDMKINIAGVKEILGSKFCWETKNCSEKMRKNCLVYLHCQKLQESIHGK